MKPRETGQQSSVSRGIGDLGAAGARDARRGRRGPFVCGRPTRCGDRVREGDPRRRRAPAAARSRRSSRSDRGRSSTIRRRRGSRGRAPPDRTRAATHARARLRPSPARGRHAGLRRASRRAACPAPAASFGGSTAQVGRSSRAVGNAAAGGGAVTTTPPTLARTDSDHLGLKIPGHQLPVREGQPRLPGPVPSVQLSNFDGYCPLPTTTLKPTRACARAAFFRLRAEPRNALEPPRWTLPEQVRIRERAMQASLRA